MDWFLYDTGLRHERVKDNTNFQKQPGVLIVVKQDCDEVIKNVGIIVVSVFQ